MKKVKVAVINTSKEVTDMLQNVLSEEGFETLAIYAHLFKNKNLNFEEYIKVNKPDVILYDVAIPYEENYKLFKELEATKSTENIPFVLTTTNKKALEQLVGDTNTYELIGKPYDLEEIVKALKNAYKSKSSKKEE